MTDDDTFAVEDHCSICGNIEDECLCEDADRDRAALDGIRELLSDAEWSADTAAAVAQLVRGTGRRIGEPAHELPVYRCPECGNLDVELCFPCWIPANDLQNRERWDPDLEASPEKDGEAGWCPTCASHVLVERCPPGSAYTTTETKP